MMGISVMMIVSYNWRYSTDFNSLIVSSAKYYCLQFGGVSAVCLQWKIHDRIVFHFTVKCVIEHVGSQQQHVVASTVKIYIFSTRKAIPSLQISFNAISVNIENRSIIFVQRQRQYCLRFLLGFLLVFFFTLFMMFFSGFELKNN